MNDFKYEAIPSYPEMGSHAISNCNGVFFGDVELNHAHSHLDSVDSNESINIENRKKYLFHIVIEQYLNLNFQRFMMIVCCLCSIPCFLYVYVNYEIFSQWFTMSNVTTYDVYVIRHADQKYITPYKVNYAYSPKLCCWNMYDTLCCFNSVSLLLLCSVTLFKVQSFLINTESVKILVTICVVVII